MSDTGATWRVGNDGRGARTTAGGQRISARRRVDETEEAFVERLRWGRFDELVIDFIAALEGASPEGTIGQYRSDLNSMVLPELGDMWLVDCDATRYDTFATDLADTRGVLRHKAAARTIGALVTWAHEHNRWPTTTPAFGGEGHRKAFNKKIVSSAPVSARKVARNKIGLEDCPTIEETWAYGDALGDAACAKWGPDARVIGDLPRLQYLTGTRIATTFALRSDAIRLGRGTCFIHHQVNRYRPWEVLVDPTTADLTAFDPPLSLVKDKDPDGHEAAIWEWALEELEPIIDGARARRGGWLFATVVPSRRPLSAVELLMREVRHDIGYRFTSHWHRHAYASLNLANTDDGGYGRNIATVAAWLGDGIDITQKTYWHPATDAPAGWSTHRPDRARR